jgi:hypothetical protein
MIKKQQEIDNYLCLISVFSDYEKYTLLEYSENDDNKLVFFNPKNTDLCLKLLKLVRTNILIAINYLERRNGQPLHSDE